MFRRGDVAVVRSTGERVTIFCPEPDLHWIVERMQELPPQVVGAAAGVPGLRFVSVPEDDLRMYCPPMEIPRGSGVDGYLELLKVQHFDLNGHFYVPDAPDDHAARVLCPAMVSGTLSEHQRWALAEGRTITFLPVLDRCPTCRQSLSCESDGNFLRIASACPYPRGAPPTEFVLDVPSGKLVVANDLRFWFRSKVGDSQIRPADTTVAYADAGLAHAFVGNSDPELCRHASEPDTYLVVSTEIVFDDDDVPLQGPPGWEEVGEVVATISTDLWWYSMCDRDEFERRCLRYGGNLERAGAAVVSVRPGRYRFRHPASPDTYGSTRCFATIEWIGPSGDPRDYLAEYDTYRISAAEYVRKHVAEYPTLYAGGSVPYAAMSLAQRRSAWQRVCDHLFCTIGNGIDWNENGVPEDAGDGGGSEPCPEFRARYRWYPLCEHSAVVAAAGIRPAKFRSARQRKVLDPTFAEVAFRVLESIISFGVASSQPRHDVRATMRLAVECYRALAVRYPEQAASDYVGWLSDGGRVERWIEAFEVDAG